MRLFRFASLFALLVFANPVFAELQTRPVEWDIDGKAFSGVLVYDDASSIKRPGLLMAPNWMGVTDEAVAMAKRVAGDDYVVLVADLYGKDVRPANDDEALAAVKQTYADGGVTLRKRAVAALAALKAQAGTAPLDATRLGAVGFCFGGSTVLELARSGADLDGVVSFHGGVETYLPTANNTILASLLVLNGAADASVADADIAAFEAEMDAAGADWQFVDFGGAVHCFSQPEDAGGTGNCRYDERSAMRAFEMMRDFLRERFAAG